jgi:regulator of replication initiation timing
VDLEALDEAWAILSNHAVSEHVKRQRRPQLTNAYPSLAATIRTLTAEVERLRTKIGGRIISENTRLDREIATLRAELTKARADLGEAVEVIRPFAEPHQMGDAYVKFAPRLIVAARALLARLEEGQ